MPIPPLASPHSWLPTFVAAFLIPAVAFGSNANLAVPPRVLVILDSSSSMVVSPDGASAYNLEQTGGDYSAANPTGACSSKFCIAKQVMSAVLPDFTGDARIGLATYYQFITQYQRANTQSTVCYYDKMLKADAGVVASFTVTTDNGPTYKTFPPPLSGYCTNNAAHQYTATKTSTNTTGTFQCGDYTYPAGATRNYGAAPPTSTSANTQVMGGTNACVAATSYTSRATGPTQWNTPTSAPTGLTNPTSSYVRQAVGSGFSGSGCPAPVAWVGGAPGGAASTSVTSFTVGTATGNWQGMTAGECTTGAPCQLYSVANTVTELDAKNSYFGLYTTAKFTPADPYTPVVSQTGTNLGTVCTANNCTTGLTATQAAACASADGGAITDGRAWSVFGIPNDTAAPFSANTVAGYTNSTPTGPNPTCTATAPCYVSLLADVPVTVGGTAFTVYDPSPNPSATIAAGSTVSGVSTAGSYWRLTSLGCPSTIAAQTGATAFIAAHAPASCSGTANMDCTFNLTSAASSQANGCTASVVHYDNVSQAACASNIGTFNYTSSANADISWSATLAPGSVCSTYGSAGTSVTAGANGCPSGGSATCVLKTNTTSAGSAVSSTPQATSSPAPAGFTGSSTASAHGSMTKDPAQTQQFNPSCPSAGGSVHSTSSAICGGAAWTPCDVVSLGKVADGTVGESTVYSCEYQPQQYVWASNQVKCTLTYPSVTWTTPTTGNVCLYNRNQYTVTPPSTTQHQCRYSAPYSRNDFVSVSQRFCEYYRARSVYQYNTFSYVYQYTNQGGELVSYLNGTAWTNDDEVSGSGSSLCQTTYHDATGFVPSNSCPPTLDPCQGPTTYCKLRWGHPNTGAGTGRYQWSLQPNVPVNNVYCRATDQVQTDAGVVLAPTPSSLVTANTMAGPTATTDTVCKQDGTASVYDYRLYSDWYDPSLTNPTVPTTAQVSPAPTYSTHFLPIVSAGTWTPTAWTEQSSKVSGLSVTHLSNGSTAPSQIFVDVPAVDSPAPSAQPLVDALDSCEMPSGLLADGGSNVDPNTLQWAHKGVCIVQDNYKNDAGVADFTPLWGSLLNAKDYIDQLRASDDPTKNSCRNYYVILATDGQENTPRGAAQGDLLAAVDDLCGGKDSTGKCNNASTYVIAFGSDVSAADLPTMNLMASHGGTGTAYPSVDKVALETNLKLVLASATAGTFSRSKPAISTDGTRIYASSFTKCGMSLGQGLRGCTKSDGVTPDPGQNGLWKGYLDAYLIGGNGGLVHEWEMNDKMNLATAPTRSLLTSPLAGCSAPPCAGDAVSDSNATLLDAIAPTAPTALQLPPATIVDWLYNASLSQPFYYDHTQAMAPGTAARTTRLADIQHSQAIAVGGSPFGSDWGGATPTERGVYQLFQSSVATRAPRILVGSNDGVLHGVIERDSSTHCSVAEDDPACPNGQEAWGWVPGELLNPGSNGLYNQVIGHRMGVDGITSVVDVCGHLVGAASSDAASCTQADWKTIAIMSMREGGTHLVALQLDNASAPPTFLWDYSDSKLGQTWSTPAVGRVLVNGEDHFAAIFGGGRNVKPNGSTSIGSGVGSTAYVVDAISGQPLHTRFTNVSNGDMASRPALYRRPASPYVDSVVMGSSDGTLQVMRFANSVGSQLGGTGAGWAPVPFFDPTRTADKTDINGHTTKVMTVVRTPGWDATLTATDVPSYAMQQAANACGNTTLCPTGDTALPLSAAPPVFNRPKIVASGTGATGDYFVGTGDAVAIELASSTIQTNYFYALRDRDLQPSSGSGPDDGQPIFVIRMPRAYEQIVSEPALISGAVIVASYTPPTTGGCGAEGDTNLYAFDPGTGALTPALQIPSGADAGTLPDGGAAPPLATNSPVHTCTGCGIPSDLLVVNNTLFFSTSAGGVQSIAVTPTPVVGDVRSFRRVR